MELEKYLEIRRLKTLIDYISHTLGCVVSLVEERQRQVLYKTDNQVCKDKHPDCRKDFFNCIRDFHGTSSIISCNCKYDLSIIPFSLKFDGRILGWIIIGPVYIKKSENDRGVTEWPAMTREKVYKEIEKVSPILGVITELINDKFLLRKSNELIKEAYRKQELVEKKLEKTVSELVTILDNSQVGIMVLKGGRVLDECNKRLAEILGWSCPSAMKGISMRQLHISESNYREYGDKYFNDLAHGKRIHIEYQLAKKSGEPVWCMLSGKAVDNSSPADLNKGVIWIVDDISKRKAYEDELSRIAETDYLTSVYNRAGFEKLFHKEMSRAERRGCTFVFLLMDLDNFKSINDLYGHDSGDLVLKHFSNCLKNSFRDIDIVGRLGGEEFAVILSETEETEGFRSAERFRKIVAESTVSAGTREIRYSVSTGLAVYRSGTDYSDLYRRADEALYKAKSGGRNKTVVYSEK